MSGRHPRITKRRDRALKGRQKFWHPLSGRIVLFVSIVAQKKERRPIEGRRSYCLVLDPGALPLATLSRAVGALTRRAARGQFKAAHDRHTDEVIAAIQKTGGAFFGGTTWRGRRAMRVSVCNWQTSDEDVERVVKAVASVLTSNR